MRRVLVCDSVLRTGIRFVKHEPGGVIGKLQYIEAAISGFPDRGFMIQPAGGDEFLHMLRFDLYMHHGNLHGTSCAALMSPEFTTNSLRASRRTAWILQRDPNRHDSGASNILLSGTLVLAGFVIRTLVCENTSTSRVPVLKQEINVITLDHAKLTRTRLLGFLALLASNIASAGNVSPVNVQPLYSFNQSPLIQIYGLPSLGQARVVPQGESNLTLRLQIANNYATGDNNSESVHLDGESHRLTLAWSQGLAGGMDWGFELPYLTQSGGFLDGTIENFHNTFGLPQGGRTDAPRNQIDYRYTRDGVNLIDLNHSVSGVGDIRLLAGKQIDMDNTSWIRSMALRASLKLPTGNSNDLLGSGSTDLALWVSTVTTFAPYSWNLYGGGGILLMTEGKVLPQQQRHEVGFGTLGISRKFGSLALNVQLDAQSPFYNDSHLRPLGTYPVQGLAGLIWEVSPRRYLEFSVSEDLVPNTSPDVAFNLSYATRF